MSASTATSRARTTQATTFGHTPQSLASRTFGIRQVAVATNTIIAQTAIASFHVTAGF
jgi:hypothetical protein